MYYLFLDDLRTPEEVTWIVLPKVEWVVVRSYNQFVQEIQTHGLPEFITFDHDLGIDDYIDPQEIEEDMIFKERNGYDCAKWLVNHVMEHNYTLPKFVVHSMNPIGKENIESYLNNFLKHQ